MMADFLRASTPRLNTVKLSSSRAVSRSFLSSALFSASGPWSSGSLISDTRNMAGALSDGVCKGKDAYIDHDEDGGSHRRRAGGPDGGGGVERGWRGRDCVRPHAVRRPQVPVGGTRRPQPHPF